MKEISKKKLIMWTVLFAPYGAYLMFKQKEYKLLGVEILPTTYRGHPMVGVLKCHALPRKKGEKKAIAMDDNLFVISEK
ncbi:MAG: hypothetical protein VX341_13745 [Bdellovibrionota bacterium]|nr:hypothetical protein [Bdellovibrionota bacterium]